MKLQPLNGEMAWTIICCFVTNNKFFRSVSSIQYNARVEGPVIYYNGGERSKGEEEDISKEDFIVAFESIKNLPEINTNSIKLLLPSSLYRKRSPLIGLLFSASIIN